MNVQELIDKLMEIEDKTKPVKTLEWENSESGTSWDIILDIYGVSEYPSYVSIH